MGPIARRGILKLLGGSLFVNKEKALAAAMKQARGQVLSERKSGIRIPTSPEDEDSMDVGDFASRMMDGGWHVLHNKRRYARSHPAIAAPRSWSMAFRLHVAQKELEEIELANRYIYNLDPMKLYTLAQAVGIKVRRPSNRETGVSADF